MLHVLPLIRPKKQQLRRAAKLLGIPLTDENLPLICRQIQAAIDDGLTVEENAQAAPSRLFLVSGGG